MNSLHKNTFFSSHFSLNCRGKLLSLEKPIVMGILNITPDSFYDGGKHKGIHEILLHVEKMLSEGASVIDIGAASTKPGAKKISAADEKKRLLPVLKKIIKKSPDALISIDTYNSETAIASVGEGACMINDVSAGRFDKKMFGTIAKLNVPYIIMHMQGTPADMQKNPKYNDVVKEVMYFLSEKVNLLKQTGVSDIIIDPGFGFGKTVQHNYELLHHLDLFRAFELPILAGLSRKSMINKVLGTMPENALNGTTALNTIALIKGANILRVHDVKEATEIIKLVSKLTLLA